MLYQKEWQELLQLTCEKGWENNSEVVARVEKLRPLFWKSRTYELRFLVFPPYGKPRIIRTLKKVAKLVRVKPENLKRVLDSEQYIGTYRGWGIELID